MFRLGLSLYKCLTCGTVLRAASKRLTNEDIHPPALGDHRKPFPSVRMSDGRRGGSGKCGFLGDCFLASLVEADKGRD